MKTSAWVSVWALALPAYAVASDEWFDRLHEHLAFAGNDGAVRAQVSGTLDAELYRFSQPVPGLIDAHGKTLFNPRLTTYVDVQLGERWYAFGQARVDRGFDPADESLEARVDEYALRFTPWPDGRFNLQAGRFASVVGNWIHRHGSWENPFVLAPLPYEHLTGIWDVAAADSPATLLDWAHVTSPLRPGEYADDKHLRVPLIWGPSYAHGVAISGAVDRFSYAVELKNSSLSSRPSSWNDTHFSWGAATVSGRLAYRPNEMWELGVSASSGSYLHPAAERTLAAGTRLEDYQQLVLAHDVSFAWHHLQLWGEFFLGRFDVPGLGVAETTAYYLEAKYKVTPQFFLAARWGEQRFGEIPTGPNSSARWGGNVWRAEIGPAYLITAHVQLKFHYYLQHDDRAARDQEHVLAAQLTVRF